MAEIAALQTPLLPSVVPLLTPVDLHQKGSHHEQLCRRVSGDVNFIAELSRPALDLSPQLTDGTIPLTSLSGHDSPWVQEGSPYGHLNGVIISLQ